MNTDKKKGSEIFSNLVQNTVDFGKKAAANAKSGVATMVEKSKASNYERRMKKYNPLFPEQFKSEGFKLPNIIMIVDDAVRRDIDVCEGAIGWLQKEADTEILCLYDEFIKESGICFIPTATCDTIYCVDSFDRTRFINAESIFSLAHNERMAELKHIAHCLGAKRCSIEIYEASSDVLSSKQSVSCSEKLGKNSVKEGYEQSNSQAHSNHRNGHIEIEFQDNNNLRVPTLKWFAFDNNIKYLIEMCCNGTRVVKTETLELSGSSSATMSRKTACAIDALGKIKSSISMDSKAAKEHHSKLYFHIEF